MQDKSAVTTAQDFPAVRWRAAPVPRHATGSV